MRLKKAEKEALAGLLEAGAETPEQLAEDFVKLLDQLRGERSHRYAVLQVAGIPVVVGPFATEKQARSAVEKAAIADKVIWVHDGWTEEGLKAHMEKVDAPPKPHEPNAAERRKLEKGFWAHVSRIRDGEATAIVGHNKQDIEIKPFPIQRGAWG